ncbi:MAG: NAD(P)H-dependent oxidoreductase, partial [Treponema sp.]|nr:NAD(P)H-dependent oxidoreductase [Treponema sp.]
VRDAFIRGIVDSGNEYVISDLYRMNSRTDMSEAEYLRDSNYRNTPDVAEDVLAEQAKINSSDAIVIIYPVFWTEAPAKLVRWFDRVWTHGFAYGERTMKTLDKGLILCTAGHTIADLEKFNLLSSMKKVMFGDRLFRRVKEAEFHVFEGMTKARRLREENWSRNLETAYEKGKRFFEPAADTFTLENTYFAAVENSASGEVSGETVFCYHQEGTTIWAEYSGGKILKGFLIGTIDADRSLHFSYQHMNTGHELKTGSCDSTLESGEGGKLRYRESWRWTDGSSGTSVIEQIG